jgi:transposase
MKMKSAPKKMSAAPAPLQSPTRERRHFDQAFRQHAVALINGGRAVADVARELGVSPYSLYEWRRKIRRKIDLQAPIPTSVEALEDEVARLREALQRSQMREEILKKSLGIFAEPSGNPLPSSRR